MTEAPPAGFSQELGLSSFHSHLLYSRGVKARADLAPYLNAERGITYDPMLFPGMNVAVMRLRRAVESGELIGLFGDFDADGITGTALLINALRDIGGSVVPYLPHRVDEGHGLNPDAVHYLKEQGVSLMITVDCGTTSISEVDLAATLGIETIITDHHTMLPTLPAACAILNPNHPDSTYPFLGLTGVGMAFKLVEALYDDMGLPWPEHLLGLVALGTVADVGPLTGENRFFVKRGLEELNKTQNIGIRALAESARLKFGSLDTESLSFGLIPRLNVAGRLGNAGLSLELLTATDSARAHELATQLEHKNSERQTLTEQGMQAANEQLEAQMSGRGLPSILIVKSDDWIPGILGLIAGRLAEQYYRPAIAISTAGELSRASARSIPEFNIIEAIREGQELYIKSGGHHQAAGFTIPTSSLPVLEEKLYAVAAEKLRDVELSPAIDIDCKVPLSMFTRENFDFIQSLAPFGEANRAPIFMTRNVRVVESRQVGSEGRHLKMRVWDDGAAFGAIAFRQGDKIHETQRGVDLVYTVGLDTWGYQPKVQLTVMDFRPSR
ncbi:MAG: single-stranded-DNA-specific exonuclease RecJ [Chloroflexi bacterium]|nr:single-stranded-DNA-specific exonuclease RecJ [Chloroflexota bacterium]